MVASLLLLVPCSSCLLSWTHSQSSSPHMHRGRNTTSGDDVANGSRGGEEGGGALRSHTLSPLPGMGSSSLVSHVRINCRFCVVRASPACVKHAHHFLDKLLHLI